MKVGRSNADKLYSKGLTRLTQRFSVIEPLDRVRDQREGAENAKIRNGTGCGEGGCEKALLGAKASSLFFMIHRLSAGELLGLGCRRQRHREGCRG